MGFLLKYNLIQNVRKRAEMFWGLLFPIILGTLFYVSFGNSGIQQMEAVPVALVREGNKIFEAFLGTMEGETLILTPMEEEDAKNALRDGKVEGIYYSSQEPSLAVAGTQIGESILESVLKAYLQNESLLRKIARENPFGLIGALQTFSDYGNLVEQVNLGGRTMDNSINYFFALIGMACLFGAFSGASAATYLRADQSALAIRKSIVPVGRLAIVASELLSSFAVQFFNIYVLLCYLHFVLGISFGPKWPLLIPVCLLGSITGVAFGLVVGMLPMREEAKVGIVVSSSLLMSFLAGLMFGNMKNIVEQHFPILNKVNPAALISDAFYSVSVYENMERYRMNLMILGAITVLCTVFCVIKLRRERYDSL